MPDAIDLAFLALAGLLVLAFATAIVRFVIVDSLRESRRRKRARERMGELADALGSRLEERGLKGDLIARVRGELATQPCTAFIRKYWAARVAYEDGHQRRYEFGLTVQVPQLAPRALHDLWGDNAAACRNEWGARAAGVELDPNGLEISGSGATFCEIFSLALDKGELADAFDAVHPTPDPASWRLRFGRDDTVSLTIDPSRHEVGALLPKLRMIVTLATWRPGQ
ncbi:hypothetical protein OAX78_02250 [Planctomycetota bacterium]|nr:hypothetical protein [Planctomycetota bacterium]